MLNGGMERKEGGEGIGKERKKEWIKGEGVDVWSIVTIVIDEAESRNKNVIQPLHQFPSDRTRGKRN